MTHSYWPVVDDLPSTGKIGSARTLRSSGNSFVSFRLNEPRLATRERLEAMRIALWQGRKEGRAIASPCTEKLSFAAAHCMKNRRESLFAARYIMLLHRYIACFPFRSSNTGG